MVSATEFLKWLQVFGITPWGSPTAIPVPMSEGGTNANLTATTNSLVYSTPTALALLATANNGVLATNGSGVPGITSTLPTGILLATDAAAALAPVSLQQMQAALLNETLACYTIEETIDALSGWTYDNGTGGVGATLTAPGNGAVVFNGQAAVDTDGKRLMVAFEDSNPTHNGIYDITQGDGGSPTVLTRVPDFDQGSNINFGDVLTVVLGDTYNGTWWQVTAEVTTVGTDPITFAQLTNTGALLKANNLSDLLDVPTARTNLGLDTMALQAASAVAITGGTATFGELRFIANYTSLVGNTSLAATDTNEAFVFNADPVDLDADIGLAAFTDGFHFHLKNQSSGDCTFTPKAGELIDGAASLTIGAGEAFTIMKTTAEWSVIGNFLPVPYSIAQGGTGGTTIDDALTNLLSDTKLNQGRLTLTTGTPVDTADVTAATTVYFTNYNGTFIDIYDGSSKWERLNFNEASIAVPSTTDTMYDVFGYNNAGTMTLEAVAWTNDTTRATALTRVAGVYCKAGDTSRKYLGSFRTTGVSGQTEFSEANRYVWNYYNRVRFTLKNTTETANSWTYGSSTVRQANANTANQVNFIRGVSEDAVECEVGCMAGGDNTNTIPAVGIGLDSTTTNSAAIALGHQPSAAGGYSNIRARWQGYPVAGKHALNWLESNRSNANTVTFYGDNGDNPTEQSGMLGTIWS